MEGHKTSPVYTVGAPNQFDVTQKVCHLPMTLLGLRLYIYPPNQPFPRVRAYDHYKEVEASKFSSKAPKCKESISG
jgi:hypothetical protein